MTSRPLIVSVTLHATFALLVVFGLPMLGRDLPEEMPIARMEIVQTVPETNLIEGDKVSTAKDEQQATVSKKPPPPPPPPPPSSPPNAINGLKGFNPSKSSSVFMPYTFVGERSVPLTSMRSNIFHSRILGKKLFTHLFAHP